MTIKERFHSEPTQIRTLTKEPVWMRLFLFFLPGYVLFENNGKTYRWGKLFNKTLYQEGVSVSD